MQLEPKLILQKLFLFFFNNLFYFFNFINKNSNILDLVVIIFAKVECEWIASLINSSGI